MAIDPEPDETAVQPSKEPMIKIHSNAAEIPEIDFDNMLDPASPAASQATPIGDNRGTERRRLDNQRRWENRSYADCGTGARPDLDLMFSAPL